MVTRETLWEKIKQNQEVIEITEPIQSEEVVVVPDEPEPDVVEIPTVDKRLKKSVDLLIKLTKIDKKKLEGLSLEEQFDRLSFLSDNLPKTKKEKNKPVVGLPMTDNNTVGREVRAGNTSYMLYSPDEWVKPEKK